MYEFLEHTADIRLKIKAPTLAELFLEGARGMNEHLFGEGSSHTDGPLIAVEEVALVSSDPVSLLVDWLSRLLLLSSIHHGALGKIDITHISPTDIRANVEVRGGEQLEDIKAVTYHGLEIAPIEGGFEACVTFDI